MKSSTHCPTSSCSTPALKARHGCHDYDTGEIATFFKQSRCHAKSVLGIRSVNEIAAITAQWGLAIPAVLVLVVNVLRAQWSEDLPEAAIAGIATVAFVKIAGALRFESRPFVVEHVPSLVPHAPDNAFPSAHLAAAGLAFAFLWPRSKVLAAVVLLVAAAIGAARVIARLHWPIDIVVGFLLGTLGIALTRAALRTSLIAAR